MSNYIIGIYNIKEKDLNQLMKEFELLINFKY